MSDQKVGLSRGSVKDKQFIQDSANNYIVESFIDVSEVAPGSGLPAAVDGQQYLVDDGVSGILGGWGSIAGLQNKDIIRYKASQLKWEIVFSASASEEGGKVYDKDSDTLFTFDGTDWNVASGAGGGVKNFAESLVASYKIANFETGNNAVFGTAGAFGGALSQEKVAPLDGKKSFKYVSGAASGNDWFYLLVDISEYARGGVIAFTFDYTWDGDEDIRVNIWDPTFTNEYSTELNLLKNTTNDNKKSRNSRTIYAHPDTETQVIVGFQINSAEVTGKTFIFDNVKVTDDIGVIGSGNANFDQYEYRANTLINGSILNNSWGFDNIVVDQVSSNGLGTFINSQANGWTYTASVRQKVNINISGQVPSSGDKTFAILKNITSGSPFAAGTTDARLAFTVENDFNFNQDIGTSTVLEVGQTLRISTDMSGSVVSANRFNVQMVVEPFIESTQFLQVPNGEKLKDTFGALIAESGLDSIDSDPYGMIASVDTSVANIHRINFTPGFFSEPPIANAIFKRIGIGTSDRWALGVVTSTYMEIYSYNSSNNRLGGPIHITCTRQAPSPDIVGVPVSIQGQTHEQDSYIRLRDRVGGTNTCIWGTILEQGGNAISYDAANGTFTVEESGVYAITATMAAAGGQVLGISKNSTSFGQTNSTTLVSNTWQSVIGDISWEGYLTKGDVIRAGATAFTGGLDTQFKFSMAKVGTQPLLDGGLVERPGSMVKLASSGSLVNTHTIPFTIIRDSSAVANGDMVIVDTGSDYYVEILEQGFYSISADFGFANDANLYVNININDETNVEAAAIDAAKLLCQMEVDNNTGAGVTPNTANMGWAGILQAGDRIRYKVNNPGLYTNSSRTTLTVAKHGQTVKYSSRVYKEDPIAWQRKNLNVVANQPASPARILPDLTFNNLEIGRTYRITGYVSCVDTQLLIVENNGNFITGGGTQPNNNDSAQMAVSAIFTATDTQLNAQTDGQSGTVFNSTFLILEELPWHAQTSRWT